MTENELGQYRSIVSEIANLRERIENLKEKEMDMVAGKVKGSMKKFPYTEIHVGIQMENPAQIRERDDLIEKYQKKVEELFREQLRIERFIDGISDAEIRQIFRYRYIDGLKQREIADLTAYTQSSISKKIKDYLQDSYNS